MNRVYSVTIGGRTLQSPDLKELLARAVSVKKGMRQAAMTGDGQFGRPPVEESAGSFSGTEMAAVH